MSNIQNNTNQPATKEDLAENSPNVSSDASLAAPVVQATQDAQEAHDEIPIASSAVHSAIEKQQLIVTFQEIFDHQPIEVSLLYDIMANVDTPEKSRMAAEALHEVMEEQWKQGSFEFKFDRPIKEVARDTLGADFEGDDYALVNYEEMPTRVYKRYDQLEKPVIGGVTLHRLTFRFGWEEDKNSHQHKGGRMVTLREGVGVFVAKNDQGEDVKIFMKPGVLVCMPAYTEHNFRALHVDDGEARNDYLIPEFRKLGIEESQVEPLADTIESILKKIQWPDREKGADDAKEILTQIEVMKNEVSNWIDQNGVLQALQQDDATLFQKVKALVMNLIQLDLHSFHVRYVDLENKANAPETLFHEFNTDGTKNPRWRNAGVDRKAHHEQLMVL